MFLSDVHPRFEKLHINYKSCAAWLYWTIDIRLPLPQLLVPSGYGFWELWVQAIVPARKPRGHNLEQRRCWSQTKSFGRKKLVILVYLELESNPLIAQKGNGDEGSLR